MPTNSRSPDAFVEIADQAPVMLWRISGDFKSDWANRAWLDFTGGKLQEQTGFAWLNLVHPDDAERVAEEFDIAFTSRKPASVQFRLRRKDGAYRWLIDEGVPFYRDGVFEGFVGSCIDVTELHDAKAELTALRGELRQLQAKPHQS